MVSNRGSRAHDLVTVTGVFVLVCGGVLVVASSAPEEPTPPEVVQMKERAQEATAALEDHDYERAKASIEAMCSQVELLERGSRKGTKASPGHAQARITE